MTVNQSGAKDLPLKNQDKPFLVCYPMTLVHGPLEVPPGGSDNKADRFKANVEQVDRLVGRIFDAVDEMGLGKKTSILFTCDKGVLQARIALTTLPLMSVNLKWRP